jgi:hypothetical protein
MELFETFDPLIKYDLETDCLMIVTMFLPVKVRKSETGEWEFA